MTDRLVDSPDLSRFLDRIAGLDVPDGDPRVKAITRRVVGDLFATIEDFDISPGEFWSGLNALIDGAPEFGLWAPGLGFEHFLDLRLDAADRNAGVQGGTPRTIEGPLYVAGAPLSEGEARLDDGSEKGDVLLMRGAVRDAGGKPIAGAIVDVWHANVLGNYSFFDQSQTPFNYRRRIRTDEHGAYRFRSVIPKGYGVPPEGSTDRLLKMLGRHGQRPAHIHFFVSKAGFRHLTSQINIDGDPYLHDDFAYATRDELIAVAARRTAPADIKAAGMDGPFAEITFDFVLLPATTDAEAAPSSRQRVAP